MEYVRSSRGTVLSFARNASALLPALLALAVSACSEPCAAGTVFIEGQFVDGAERADKMDVSVQIDGGPARDAIVARHQGAGSDRFVLTFASGYPAGRMVQVTITALAGGEPVGMASVRFAAANGCTSIALRIDGNNVDAAAPSADLAAAAADGSDAVAQCPAAAFFCDDFESGVTAWDSTIVGGGFVDAEVTSARAYRGTHSFHAFSTGADGGAASGAAAVVKNLGGYGTGSPLDIRAHFYAEVAPGDHAGLLWLVDNAYQLSSLGTTATGDWFINDLNGEHAALSTMPLGRWFCTEMLFEPIDAQSGRVRVYVDDAVVLDLTTSASTMQTAVQAGLVRAPPDSAQDLYLDDVAIGTARLGCD